MKIFQRRDRPRKDRPELHEAQEAGHRAEKSVREAKATGKEVTKETVKLKRLRESNNFAEAIRQALGGTG